MIFTKAFSSSLCLDMKKYRKILQEDETPLKYRSYKTRREAYDLEITSTLPQLSTYFVPWLPWPKPSSGLDLHCRQPFFGVPGSLLGKEWLGFLSQHLHVGCETNIPNFKRIPHHGNVWLQTLTFNFLISSVSIFPLSIIPEDRWV